MRTPVPLQSIIASAALLLVLAGCQPMEPEPDPASSLPADQVGDDVADAVVTRVAVEPDGVTVTAAGYVSGFSEEGGTCTFTFSTASLSIEASSSSLADATVTMCPEVSTSIPELGEGSVTVTLTYVSDLNTLTSEPVTLEIP